MAHTEERTHWIKEGLFGLGTGILYGLTNVVVGHPLDTIKTKMQAQTGFERTTMMGTLIKTFKNQGFLGFYRGSIPPLIGSGIYRSSQFASLEAVYTYMDTPFGTTQIPFTGGIEYRIIMAGIVAGSVRAIIECPMEYAKVRRQTNQNWKLHNCYTGMGITLTRNLGLLTSFFILLDSGKRHFPEQFAHPVYGPFLISGTAATASWWAVWPLEVVKSQIQTHYSNEKMSSLQRLRNIIQKKGGFFQLYRGLAPGSLRSFIGNGASMAVMTFAQRKVTEYGLRS